MEKVKEAAISGLDGALARGTAYDARDQQQRHPLLELLLTYHDEFCNLKEENRDLDSYAFNRCYGLSISVPNNWPLYDSIKAVIKHSMESQFPKEPGVVVIYHSSTAYRSLYDVKYSTHYFAWQEFYVAMDRAGKDARELKRFKHMLENADLTIFCGAPVAIPEVIDQVRAFCEGCLIVLE